MPFSNSPRLTDLEHCVRDRLHIPDLFGGWIGAYYSGNTVPSRISSGLPVQYQVEAVLQLFFDCWRRSISRPASILPRSRSRVSFRICHGVSFDELLRAFGESLRFDFAPRSLYNSCSYAQV